MKTTLITTSKHSDKVEQVKQEIKMLLHAGYDRMRNRAETYERLPAWCPYYGEAFGMLRTLRIVGLGEFGAVNVEGTLNWWFSKICREVENEEGLLSNGQCDHCFERYGKDSVRTK